MSKEKNIVPELRFPEFVNDGEWEEVQLSTIAERKVKKNKDEDISLVFTNSAKDGIVDQKDFFERRIVDVKNLNNYYIVKSNYFVYNPRISRLAPVGPISKNKTGKTGIMSPLYTVFAFEQKEDVFYEYYFLTEHWFNSIRKISNTGARHDRMNISSSDFMGTLVLFPTNSNEQQKIANCLSSLDTLITAETEKLDYLKEHKKGLLQALFPANGATKPSFRFAEFEGDGDWEERIIGKACEKPFSGGTPKSNNTEYYGGEIPFIRSAEINKENTKLYLTILGFKNSSAKMVEKGDVLVAMYGANSGDVGISKINGAINQAILCLRSKSNNHFLHQYLIHKKDWIIKKYLQGGQGNLSGDIVKSVQLLFPSLQEQQKIANCFSSVDHLIEAQTTKIETLKKHKKGLMQQLFPNVNSVAK